MQLQIGILFLTHLILPLVFLIWLWKSSDNKLSWVTKFLTVTLFIIYIYLVGRWDWISYYLKYVFLVLLVIVAIKSISQARYLPIGSKSNIREWVVFGATLIPLFIFSSFNIITISGYFYKENNIELSFPLKNGTYYIAHGGNSPIINHHNVVQSQRYALDIAKLNSFGRKSIGIYPSELTNYEIYGDTLYSPCDGVIVKEKDNAPDLVPPEMDKKNPAGNFVMIECEEVEIILAHMMHNSLLVRKGDLVKRGQPLGKVGNSGNTSEPHLHIHARKDGTKDSILDGIGVPLVFADRFLVRNSLVRKNSE